MLIPISSRSKQDDPKKPQSDEELENFAIFLSTQGELTEDDETESDEEGIPHGTPAQSVSTQETQGDIVDDLLTSGAIDGKEEDFGKDNELLGYNEVSTIIFAPAKSDMTSPHRPLQGSRSRCNRPWTSRRSSTKRGAARCVLTRTTRTRR